METAGFQTKPEDNLITQTEYMEKTLKYVNTVYDFFVDKDQAETVDSMFGVADEKQKEILLKNSRYLITPNDDAFKKYLDIMSQADIPTPQLVDSNNFSLNEGGSEIKDAANNVAIEEIPVEARTIAQVILSKQPKNGEVLRDIFRVAGLEIGKIITKTHLTLSIGSLSLNKVLIVGSKDQIMFVPPMGFEKADETSKQKLLDEMGRGLEDYSQFDGQSFLEAFRDGLYNDVSE